MRKILILLFLSGLVLSGCGLWRRSNSNAAAVAGETNPLIPERSGGMFARPEPQDLSVPIEEITELKVEPTPSGAIVLATGVAARQGAYQARLVPDNVDLIPSENGELTFSFRVIYPERRTQVGTRNSRTIVDGFTLPSAVLKNVRVIRVQGRLNEQVSRRR